MEKPLGMEDLEEIKIKPEDEAKGFYVLLNNGTGVCLPNHRYLVPKYVLSELEKEGIKFRIKNNDKKIKSRISNTS